VRRRALRLRGRGPSRRFLPGIPDMFDNAFLEKTYKDLTGRDAIVD
jgi:hypothetical protein